jgi:hypothetical protein
VWLKREREIEKERERERVVGSTTEKNKGREHGCMERKEKRECEKERAIVYMFEKWRLTWLKKEREGEGERKRRGWFRCLKSDSERG